MLCYAKAVKSPVSLSNSSFWDPGRVEWIEREEDVIGADLKTLAQHFQLSLKEVLEYLESGKLYENGYWEYQFLYLKGKIVVSVTYE